MPTSARDTRETAASPLSTSGAITARYYARACLIADDHRLMREGTAALLEADPRIDVVGLASGGREAVELATRLKPDVALLDVGMPDIGGVEACAAIRARLPGVRVLMLTVSEDALDVRAALSVGAAAIC